MQRPLSSISDLKAWLDQGPLLMDGHAWFGYGHWFVGIGYDQNGVYIRDRAVTTSVSELVASVRRGGLQRLGCRCRDFRPRQLNRQ